MSDEIKIAVEMRGKLGSAECRRLRKRGRIPANIYGHGLDPVPVSFAEDVVTKLVESGTHVLGVEVEGHKSETTMIRDVQWDTFSEHIQHIDLLRVDPDERVTLDVAVEVRGISPGVIAGGILDQHLHSLKVDCPVIRIPNSIVVRISDLQIGGIVHVRELQLPEGLHVQNDPEAIVVRVVQPQLVEEVAPAVAEGPAEPELVGRKVAEPEEE